MPKPTDPNKWKYMFTDDIKFLQKTVVIHPHDPKKFLIIRKSPTQYNNANKWDMPGGNVLYGEGHEESLRNEVRQETGLEITDIYPVEVKTFTNYHPEDKVEYYYLIILYVAKATSETVTLSEEHTEYRWLTYDEFQHLNEVMDFMRSHVDKVHDQQYL